MSRGRIKQAGGVAQYVNAGLSLAMNPSMAMHGKFHSRIRINGVGWGHGGRFI